jgi:hypothetical protein
MQHLSDKESSRRKQIKLGLPRRLVQWGIPLPDNVRSMGIHIQAGKGSGKSRLMGRVIVLRDFTQGMPQVVFDPNGATVDNFLDALARLVARLGGNGHLSSEGQKRLWQRVRYVDMSGKSGYVVPFPLYYRLGQESLKDVAWRYLEAILRLDPELKEAPIQGWNAVAKLGSRTGMVLAALGCQITEAYDLLNRPRAWRERLQGLAANSPDHGLLMAVEFFLREYPEWKPQDRERAKSAWETKLDMFTLAPSMRAMFGATIPSIDWQEAIDKGQTVLLDFRHEQNSEHRRFKMLWAFLYFLEFIKHRGRGRHRPVGLVIDELTALYNFDIQAGADIFASDLDELVNQIARDFSVWLTLAHQERFQIDEKSHKTLMTMGTQVLGVTADFESALAMAQELFRVDPHKVKRYERVWMAPPFLWPPEVIDVIPVEYTVEEQDRMAASQFKDLGLFEFLVRPARREGDTTGELISMSLANLDRGVWNDEALVAELRLRLSRRDGIPIETVLEEIDQRHRHVLTLHRKRGKKRQLVKSTAQRATLAYQNEPDDDDFSEFWEPEPIGTAGAGSD